MAKRSMGRAALVLLGLVVAGARCQTGVQAKAYAAAAPLREYFMPEKALEVELARSAAPASIADGAEVLVLTQEGYTTAVKGRNGFVCLVERSWGKTTDDAEFWNPKVRAPICVNAPAAKTYLPIVLLKTKLVLAGRSNAEIGRAVKAGFGGGTLPALEANAMCYMMSKQQYLSDEDRAWHPHMMWFVANDAAQSWGANEAGVPVIAGNVPEDRMTVFMLVVGHWSDGTAASH